MNRVAVAAVRIALLTLAALPLASCGSGVRFVRQDQTEYPAKPSNAPVEVHEGESFTPHVVIGTITAERTLKASYGGTSNVELIMNDLRKAARKVGADALVDVRPLMTETSMDKPRMTVTATAIRYLEEKTTVSGEDSGSR